MKNLLNTITLKLDALTSHFYSYIKKNSSLLYFLAGIGVIGYGFELFNFNLTIDEEVHAFTIAPSVWIAQGRWGMYLLNKFVLPYTVLPFLPLFLALLFHVFAALLLLDSWNVISKTDRMVIGAIFVAYPGIVYMYTFSTINYGIGVGLFCTGLSVLAFERLRGWKRGLAVVPAAFAIAIHQGFLVALVAAFIVNYIFHQIDGKKRAFADLLFSAIVVMVGATAYYLIQKFLVHFFVSESDYVASFFDMQYSQSNLKLVLTNICNYMIRVYSGDKGIYGVQIGVLWILICGSIIGFVLNLLHSNVSIIKKIIAGSFFILLLLLPFMTGIFLEGNLAMRFLIALPIVLAGLVRFGLVGNHKIFRTVIVTISVFGVLQFATSTNHLFAASNLALQTDRVIATNLIKSIEESKYRADSKEIKYLEMIGYLDLPSTELIPKTETFGASFFQWDQGNVSRVVLFLKTLGYQGITALPVERKGLFIEQAQNMPSWPEEGSVTVVEDTALVKFSDYSYSQKLQICVYLRDHPQGQIEGFCE